MQKLLEISQLVTGFITGDALKMLFEKKGADHKTLLFLEGLLHQRWQTDEEAARELYKADAHDKRYQMLKSRIRKRLFDFIFTIDISSQIKTSYYRELIKCNRLLYAANQLFILGKINLAFDFFKEAAAISSKYGFTELCISSLAKLRELMGYMGDIRQIHELTEQLKELSEIHSKEILLDGIDFEFRICVRGILTRTQLLNFDKESKYKQAIEIFKNATSKSHRMLAAIHRINIYYYHLKKDHAKVLKQCLDFEHYLLRGQKFTDLALVAEVALQKLDTCIYLRDFKTGKISAIQCDGLYRRGNYNRLIYQQYYLLLCIHTGEMEAALKVFTEVTADTAFKKYPEERIERWRIFEAMLNYLLPDGKMRKFNIHKFLNEVPLLSRDKAGFNLSIIIAQFCLLIKRGEFDKAMDKYDSLKSYASRYIKPSENPRSYYFIKLLMLLIKSDFDTIKSSKSGERLLMKLKQSSVSGRQALDTMEVAPYDVLWIDILERIKKHQQSLPVLKRK
jgi:hypothetical protein